MLEMIVLFVGAVPFLVGLYALKRIKKSNDEGSDDQPPPPDPEPPRPVLPPSPQLKRFRHPVRRADRAPVLSARSGTPSWKRTVRR